MMRRTTKTNSIGHVTHEADEQALLFEWAAYEEVRYPELELLFHCPNEGRRSYRAAYELKRQGLRAGVPDICLPVARGQYHALYIEMKRARGGKVSEAQKWWIDKLNNAGNLAVVCHGFDEARDIVLKYLNSQKTN